VTQAHTPQHTHSQVSDTLPLILFHFRCHICAEKSEGGFEGFYSTCNVTEKRLRKEVNEKYEKKEENETGDKSLKKCRRRDDKGYI
jgi:hypothetical protein